MQAKKHLLVMLILLALIGSASAAIYYVAPDGSDTNPGTEAQPWKTTTKAGNTAVAGDTVLFKPGTYTAQLAPAHSGSDGSMITFKAQTRRTAIIDVTGSSAVLIQSKPEYSIYIDYIRIEGFEIANGNTGVAAIGGHTNIEVVDNYIHNTGAGVYFYPEIVNHSLVENNTIRDIGGFGIILGSTTTYSIIRGNIIYDILDDGIWINTGDNYLIENNIIHTFKGETNHQDGISANSLSNSIIRYNIIYDWTQNIYLGIFSTANSTVSNVYIYGNHLYTNKYYTERGAGGKGVYIDARSDTATISNIHIHSNTFAWIGYNEIRIDANPATPVSGIKIYNNIFYSNPDISAIFVTASKVNEVTSNYNLFYSCLPPSYEGAYSVIDQDPKFVDFAPYDGNHINVHLLSSSPAINTGNPSLASDVNLPSPFVDVDGNERPQGAGYDIGAYTFQGTVQVICGNNSKEAGEVCDGTDLASQTCQSQGFAGGTLLCTANCNSFNTSNCTTTECIDNNKLLDYISQWKQGSLGMAALMQKIGVWKAGTGCQP